MIQVQGIATYKVQFTVQIAMSEEKWDALSEKEQNEILDAHIAQQDEMRGAEMDDCDVWEVDPA